MRNLEKLNSMSTEEMTLKAAQAQPATVGQLYFLDRHTRGTRDVFTPDFGIFFVTFYDHEGVYAVSRWQILAFRALMLLTDIRDRFYF